MITMRLRSHVASDGAHHDRFDAVVGCQVIVTSRQPAYSGARRLIALGHSPDEMVAVVPPGGAVWPPQRLGELAKWTVKEGDRRGLFRTKWLPMRTGGAEAAR